MEDPPNFLFHEADAYSHGCVDINCYQNFHLILVQFTDLRSIYMY